MKFALFLACAALCGCTSDAIAMRNPATGQTAQCGPYGLGWARGGLQLAERERQCVADFQRQGFERIP